MSDTYDVELMLLELSREPPSDEELMFISQQRNGIPKACNGCGKPLLLENLYVDDGCPCNTPRGINFETRGCAICREDTCCKPGHRLVELFGFDANEFRELAASIADDEEARLRKIDEESHCDDYASAMMAAEAARIAKKIRDLR